MSVDTYRGRQEPAVPHPMGTSARRLRLRWGCRTVGLLGVLWLVDHWAGRSPYTLVMMGLALLWAWRSHRGLAQAQQRSHEVSWEQPAGQPWQPWDGFSPDWREQEALVHDVWTALHTEFQHLQALGLRMTWSMIERRHPASSWARDNTGPTLVDHQWGHSQLWLNLVQAREHRDVQALRVQDSHRWRHRWAHARQRRWARRHHQPWFAPTPWLLQDIVRHMLHHEMGHTLSQAYAQEVWQRTDRTLDGAIRIPLVSEGLADVWGLLQGFSTLSPAAFRQQIAAVGYFRQDCRRSHRTMGFLHALAQDPELDAVRAQWATRDLQQRLVWVHAWVLYQGQAQGLLRTIVDPGHPLRPPGPFQPAIHVHRDVGQRKAG